MSETASIGVAASVVAPCIAIVAAVAGIASLGYQACKALSKAAQREAERLEKELATPLPPYATMKDALAEFSRNLALAKINIAQSPVLSRHGESLPNIMALRNSIIGRFVDKKSVKDMIASARAGNVEAVLANAGKRLTQVNAKHVTQAIKEVARKTGFVREGVSHKRNGSSIMVLEDDKGRALIAEVTESAAGAKLNLDLTGFCGSTCHGVMDNVLKALVEKGIRIDGISRRSHYKQEGVLLAKAQSTVRTPRQSQGDQEKSTAEQNRLRQFHHNRGAAFGRR